MSSINYCTLDEAWGKHISSKPKKNIYTEHKKEFDKNNPLRTPNVNYECLQNNKFDNTNIPGYQKSHNYINYNNSNTKKKSKPPEYYEMNQENQDLFNFIQNLNMDEDTTKILLSKML